VQGQVAAASLDLAEIRPAQAAGFDRPFLTESKVILASMNSLAGLGKQRPFGRWTVACPGVHRRSADQVPVLRAGQGCSAGGATMLCEVPDATLR
jgi:hypothetical protein